MSQEIPARQENKMGTMPENKLLLTISIPMMISMLVQALYNVVDSMFVSYISEDALTAVSLAFPIQNLMIAVSVGTGIGINALLSRSLGERNELMANKAANVGISLNIISSLFFTLIGLFFTQAFYEIQVDIPSIIEYGYDYLFYICVFSIFMFGQIVFSRLLQATGKTMQSMIIQLCGAGLNIILDPIMIFGYFGCPAMGVKGAAIATIIGQAVGTLVGLILNIKYNPEIRLSIRGMIPSIPVVKSIYAVGFPSIIMQSTASVMAFFLNGILLKFTETAAAVFGVYFKIQGFFFMPVFGLNNGIVPIVAYNYGAKKPERITKTTKLAVIYAVAILVIGFLVFQIIPHKLLGIFNASEEMLAIGTVALRLISPSFLIAGFVIVASSVLQALGRGFSSMIISLVRQLIFLVPVAYLLSLTGNLNLVWLSYPIAEVVAGLMSAYYLREIYRKVILPLKEQPEETSLPKE